MKTYTYISVLFFCIFYTSINAQTVNIPDTNFKNALLAHNPTIDTSGDGEIQISEANAVTGKIDVYDKNISSLIGIQAFVNIRELEAGVNNLTELDVSQNVNLEILKFIHNDVSSMNLNQNVKLKEIWCNFNKFTTLDVSNNINLEFISAPFMNTFTHIDLSENINLEQVFFGNTQLSELDVSNNPNLNLIETINCPITNLNVSQNPLINRLLLSNTLIQSIDVSQNPLLQYLVVDNTPINSIDFTNNPVIISFNASNCNNLTQVKANNGNNEGIIIFKASSCPNLELICVDDENYAVNNFEVDNTSIFSDLCDYNVIKGTVTYDLSGNNCSDGNVLAGTSLGVEIVHGNESYTTLLNSDGSYKFVSTNEGEFLTSLYNPPNYYTSTPISNTSNFTGVGNSETVNFCIEPISSVNDLAISVYPAIDEPRPGFDTLYKIIYKNTGTTQLTGSVSFEYDEAKIQFLGASQTVNSQTSNTLTFDFADLIPFETRIIYLEFNVFTPPTTNIDDILEFTATINPVSGDETEDDNVFNFEQIVIGSYDPNDIRVLEGDKILLEDADKYLHYIIRFQNTGTASAINVNVENVLDDKLDWATMQIESLSHSGRVEIQNGNQVKFIFDDINLPDSTNDEPNSHGYITYKIKPKNNVVVGDVFNGVADIFFDFNPPITTNTVSTEIVNTLSTEEYGINSFSTYPNPAVGTLNIEGTQAIKSITIYDLHGRELKKIKFGDNTLIHQLDVENLSQGVYFLEIQSDNKKELKKFIKK